MRDPIGEWGKPQFTPFHPNTHPGCTDVQGESRRLSWSTETHWVRYGGTQHPMAFQGEQGCSEPPGTNQDPLLQPPPQNCQGSAQGRGPFSSPHCCRVEQSGNTQCSGSGLSAPAKAGKSCSERDRPRAGIYGHFEHVKNAAQLRQFSCMCETKPPCTKPDAVPQTLMILLSPPAPPCVPWHPGTPHPSCSPISTGVRREERGK